MSGVTNGTGEDIAEDVFEVAEDLNRETNGTLANRLGQAGEDVLSAAINAFSTNRMNLRMTAMSFACMLCKT